MAAGSIVIDLLMRTGSFETDTGRAEKRLRQFQKSAVDVGKTIGTGLAVGATVAAVAFDQLIKSAANFKDLEEVTGATAEGIASTAVALATAGVSADSFAGDLVKLTKNLTGVDDESKAAGAALAALGIPIEDFKKLDPVTQIDKLTAAFGNFADGPQKAAVATALFGKSGAELLKVFKALEEQGGRQVILTQEQIELADAYADAQAKSMAQLKLYAQAAATQALPAFNALTEAGKDFIAELIGIDKQTGKLGQSTAVKDFAEGAVKALGFIIDAGDGVARTFNVIGTYIGGAAAAVVAIATGDFKQARNIVAETQADIDRILSREIFSDKLTRALANQPGPAKPGETKPTLQFNGATSSKAGKDDPTKKLLDSQLAALKDAAAAEKALLGDRNRFIDLYNDQGLLSIQEYYAARKTAADEATAAELAAIDKQIAALAKFRDMPKRSAQDKADSQGKIDDLLRQRAELERQAGAAGVEATIKLQQEQAKYAIELQSLNAQVLEFAGNLREAAAIRFDQQNDGLKKRLTAEGDTAGLAQLETIRKITLAQAEYGQEVTETEKVLQSLGAAEDRIAIAQQLGATGELESLRRLGVARQDAILQLEGIVAAQEAIAQASGSDALVRQAEAARVALEKLKAEADPLGDKFRGIFQGSFGGALSDFINGTKSAKDAFRDFIGDVTKRINDLIAQNFADALFGKGGPFGDLIGGLGGILGGSSKPSGGSSFPSVFGSGGGGLIQTLGSFFGGAFAGGGDVLPNRSYLIGEQGPEMFVPRTAGTILPASQTASMGGATTINAPITIPVSGAVDRRTREQIASDVQRAVGMAVARGTA